MTRLLVDRDLDFQIPRLAFKLSVRQGSVPDLVERIGRIRDELSEKDLRMRVKGVCDKMKQLLHLRAILELLRLGALGGRHVVTLVR